MPGLALQSAGNSISLRFDHFSPDCQLFCLICFPSNSPEEISSTSVCNSIPKCIMHGRVKCDSTSAFWSKVTKFQWKLERILALGNYSWRLSSCLSVRMFIFHGFLKLFNTYKRNEMFSQLYSLVFKTLFFCKLRKWREKRIYLYSEHWILWLMLYKVQYSTFNWSVDLPDLLWISQLEIRWSCWLDT